MSLDDGATSRQGEANTAREQQEPETRSERSKRGTERRWYVDIDTCSLVETRTITRIEP